MTPSTWGGCWTSSGRRRNGGRMVGRQAGGCGRHARAWRAPSCTAGRPTTATRCADLTWKERRYCWWTCMIILCRSQSLGFRTWGQRCDGRRWREADQLGFTSSAICDINSTVLLHLACPRLCWSGVVRLPPATTTAQPAVWWAGGDRGKCGSQHTHSGWESRGFPDWASPLWVS